MEYIYSQESARILVVDDERVIRDILSDFLSSEGFRVTTMEDGQSALEELETQPYDLVITDLMMPRMGGIELLEEIKRRKFSLITIIMTGFGTVETSIQAMKQGAHDYILKPFKVDEMLQVIKRALEKQRLEQENIKLKEVMNLYKVSEAMTSTLSLDHILHVVLEVTKSELDAEAVSLILAEPRDFDDQPVSYLVQTLGDQDTDENPFGVIDYDVMLGYFADNPFLVVSGPKAKRFFSSPPTRRYLSSLLSVPLKSRDQVLGIINAYCYKKNYRYTDGHTKLLVILASRAAQAIENARLFENLQRTFRETIQGLVITLEAKDKYTSGHSRRVTEYGVTIAKALNFPPAELEKMEWAGLLHDIGKIGIPDPVLHKGGALSTAEAAKMAEHTIIGERILSHAECLRPVAPLVRAAHERWDGLGYPDGLEGEAIPLASRIVFVCDAFHAMTSDRPYRQALTAAEALDELRAQAGRQFDPRIVEAFARILPTLAGQLEPASALRHASSVGAT